jgi:hypothetical protein
LNRTENETGLLWETDRQMDSLNVTYETVDNEKNAQEGCMTSLEIFDFRHDISFDIHHLLKMSFP